MARAVAESIPPDRSTMASFMGRLDYTSAQPVRRRGALRLGVPAPARRRPLLSNVGRRTRRADPGRRLRHRASAVAAAAPRGPGRRGRTGRGGVDLAPAMLARAATRVARLGEARRRRALLLRGDLRALPCGPRFAFAVA